MGKIGYRPVDYPDVGWVGGRGGREAPDERPKSASGGRLDRRNPDDFDPKIASRMDKIRKF